jgi:aminoglycoside N3'-acetyltransferase
MQEVTKEQVMEALQAAGVRGGDGLLVHSAIQFLGKPAGGVAMYIAALAEVLEIAGISPAAALRQPDISTGTLAVPAFNFAFARGEPYDPDTTPSDGMGIFSETVRRLPAARRTPHPLQSLAVVGRFAADLAGRDTPSAFDPGSAFERMLALDFKLLLLGADIQAVSMLHYCEQRAGVPYRYWKEFTAPVKGPAGWQDRTYRMFARDLDADPRIELNPVRRLLETRGQWISTRLNYGLVSTCRLVDFVVAVDQFLSADPWSLVVNRAQASAIIEARRAGAKSS